MHPKRNSFLQEEAAPWDRLLLVRVFLRRLAVLQKQHVGDG